MTGILDILSGKLNTQDHEVYKNLLDLEREFNLPFLTLCVSTYIDTENWAVQSNGIPFDCVINIILLEGKVKVYNRSK